jgi:hypothetical protein
MDLDNTRVVAKFGQGIGLGLECRCVYAPFQDLDHHLAVDGLPSLSSQEYPAKATNTQQLQELEIPQAGDSPLNGIELLASMVWPLNRIEDRPDDLGGFIIWPWGEIEDLGRFVTCVLGKITGWRFRQRRFLLLPL